MATATSVIDFAIKSLRGGLNNSDPPIAIGEDQCTVATNVEFLRSLLGERRRGTTSVTIATNLANKERVTMLHRHIPGTDDTAAELWAFGFTTGGSGTLSRKTTSWTDVTGLDTINLSGFAPYQWQAASLHGKIFLAYDSDVDRLHVCEAGSTTARKVGLAAPAAPTSADTGSGTFTGTRYYRVRMVFVDGSSKVTRRSEPSAVLTDTPSGTGSAIRVTKPTTIEDATHWELEASIDNANFYMRARTAVGTTTFDDDTPYETGYALDYDLSETIGDWTLIPSVRYLVADEDRLVHAGSWEDDDLSSIVGWTPVGRTEILDGDATGTGNDERIMVQSSPYSNLDGLLGGPITGMSAAVSGEIWITKFSRIYKLVRAGRDYRAYDTIAMSTDKGGLHGSLVVGQDQNGKPCLYCLDPALGPIRIGAGGIKQCGADIRVTWESVNLDATKVVCSGYYYPTTRQVIWNVAYGAGVNLPNRSIVLQTNEQKDDENGGLRGGWSEWTGPRSTGIAACLFSTDINDNDARNRVLVPFIGIEHGTVQVHRTDTGSDDNGTAYAAQIRTKPYTIKTLLQRFGVLSGILMAKAVASSTIVVKVIRDFGLETTFTSATISLAATASETEVNVLIDGLKGAELRTAQFDFSDPATPGTGRWELNHLALSGRTEQRN